MTTVTYSISMGITVTRRSGLTLTVTGMNGRYAWHVVDSISGRVCEEKGGYKSYKRCKGSGDKALDRYAAQRALPANPR